MTTAIQTVDLAEALAEHAATTPLSAIPAAVLDHLERDLVDGLAACLGGLHAPGVDTTRELIGEAVRPGQATVFGTRLAWPAAFAAQANSTAGHALDFDDVLDEGGGMHAGVPVHCAALALADELGGVRGTDYLGAVALGLDVAVRLALAPSDDYGWHRTSAFGIFGVAVAAGRLLGLDTLQMRNALGIAFSQASGNRQCIADGALSKRLQSGFGARDGVVAAQLAQRGLTGAHRIFEGANGFFPLYQRGGYDRESVLAGLGREFLSSRIALKPYPCGRNLHGVIDAALAVREQLGGRAIERVEVGLGERAAATANRAYPQDVVQAQFSIPFAVALALAQGSLAIADFDRPAAAAPAVKELFERTTLVPSTSGGGGRDEVQVTAHLVGGGSESTGVSVASGHPSRPLSQEQLRTKFLDCNHNAGGALDDAATEQVLALASRMRTLGSTRELTAALAAG